MDQVQIAVQPSLKQIKNLTKNIGKETMIKNINYWINNDSKTAKWYKAVSELIPPAIDKNTPRELAVITHRLRLGYRANWEIITEIDRPCNHCDTNTNMPLLHYLLQCPHTASFRNNINTPEDIYSDEATKIACNIAKHITQNNDFYANTLTTHPPLR